MGTARRRRNTSTQSGIYLIIPPAYT